jgi:hypothetical protein
MTKNHKFLMLLAVVVLIGAGSATGLTTASKGSAQSEAAVTVSATLDAHQSSACSADAQQAFSNGSTQVKPGCCATQCNVDKDCDKICGKGNCACIQENPCCRRCVY